MKSKIIPIITLCASVIGAYFIMTILYPDINPLKSAQSNIDEKIAELGRPFNPEIMQTVKENDDKKFPGICKDNKTINSTMGVSEDVYFLDKKVASAEEQPCIYCIGFIFQMYMKTLNEFMKENELKTIGKLNKNNVKDFRRTFYGVRSKKTCVQALTQYGLGVEIPNISLAKPGDLIQFWRDFGNGHCVILTSLDEDFDGVNGINFWSAQRSTKGVSYNTEYLIEEGGHIDPGKIYIVRPVVPVVPGYSPPSSSP